MQIKENVSLAQYTTFKTGGNARFFCAVFDDAGLVAAITFAKERRLPIFILGGGSNLLISDAGFNGLVIKNEYKGVSIEGEYVYAGAGEQWDPLVEKTVEAGLGGFENLSAIPGTVGAVPIQNIGAYGSEASKVILSVRAFDTKKMIFVELSNKECDFAYRDSMFKHKKGRYVVTRVDFRLKKDGAPDISYKDVSDYFVAGNMQNPTIKEVREAIINIRWNKLPDWKLWGTAGSFFKNPVISKRAYAKLKKRYPDMPAFPESFLKVKIPLGWVLDKVCAVKNLCVGGACVYEKQALVLVAKPGAKSEEVISLSRELMKRVKEKTGIDVECEVEWVN